MGGKGSGRRWHDDAAECTGDYRQLDVRRWQREGFLIPGRAFGWQWTSDSEPVAWIQVRAETDRVILTYRYQRGDEEWRDECYPARLDWTPCNYGGARVWFRCPAVGCGRRVAILYLGSAIFACRHCYRLVYPSQRENPGDRAMRQADKIRERLGWKSGILNGEGSKPKGMHWRTFVRLTARHHDLVMASWADVMRRCGLWPMPPDDG